MIKLSTCNINALEVIQITVRPSPVITLDGVPTPHVEAEVGLLNEVKPMGSLVLRGMEGASIAVMEAAQNLINEIEACSAAYIGSTGRESRPVMTPPPGLGDI